MVSYRVQTLAEETGTLSPFGILKPNSWVPIVKYARLRIAQFIEHLAVGIEQLNPKGRHTESVGRATQAWIVRANHG